MAEGKRDNRSATRDPVNLKVDWKVEGHFLFENSTNISEQGIFVETKKPMEPGTMLNLQFKLPDTAGTIEVLGEVIWVNQIRPGQTDHPNPGMGVRFVNLKEIDKET